MTTSICIPYKDKSDVLRTTLMSIISNTKDYKVYLMDNDSQTTVVSSQPQIKIYNSPENLGFGRALNILIDEALKENPDGDVVVMNDDIELLQNNWLDKLKETLYSKKDYGIVGPVCLYPDGRVQHAGAFINDWFTGQHFQNIPDEPKEFEYIPFVVVMIKNSLIKKLKQMSGTDTVFDEKFEKAYSEDVDVCYTARKLGYKCILEPQVKLVHLEGTSQKMGILGDRGNIQRLQTKNKEYFISKWENVDNTDYRKDYGVCFVARLAGNLSYQQIVKQIAPRLDATPNFDVSILPEETVYSPMNIPAEWELRKLRQKPFDEKRICIRYTEGQYGYLAYSRDIIYTTTENWSDHIPFEWRNNINKFKQCWVTSNRVKQTFIEAGVVVPIKVVPHGIDLKVWDYKKKPYHNEHLPKFIFFVNDMYGPRKNMEYIVRAFTSLFGDNKEVGLVIQSSGIVEQLRQYGYGGDVTTEQGTTSYKTKIINKWLNANGWKGDSNIFVFDNWISQDDLISLYARANAVVCLGNEGWGLCGAQSMAMKKPLIYLNEGGMKDYADGFGFAVEVEGYTPSRQNWLQQNYNNGLWAVPNMEKLIFQMGNVVEHKDKMQFVVDAAYENIKENFNWDKVVLGIQQNILELIEREKEKKIWAEYHRDRMKIDNKVTYDGKGQATTNINTREYWNELYKEHELSDSAKYGELPIINFNCQAAVPEYEGLIKEHSSIPVKKVLEIGCGTKTEALEMNRAGYDVTAIDISDYIIEMQKQKCVGPKYLQMDARQLMFFNEEFDFIYSSDILEHFHETKQTIQGWLRVLKPGGVIAITTIGPDHESIPTHCVCFHKDNLYEELGLDKEKFEIVVTRCGDFENKNRGERNLSFTIKKVVA